MSPMFSHHSPHHVPYVFPSFSHHFLYVFPSFFHHFLYVFPSFSHHFLYVFPSFPHHFLYVFPSFSHHFLYVFPSFSHHFLYVFPSFSHHFLYVFPSFSLVFAMLNQWPPPPSPFAPFSKALAQQNGHALCPADGPSAQGAQETHGHRKDLRQATDEAQSHGDQQLHLGRFHQGMLPGLVNIQKAIENGHWNSGFSH